MGTIRRITELQLGSIATTKLLSITSSETLYQISSGNRAVEIMNFGNINVTYGQSSLLASSGLFIASNGGAKFWDSVHDVFKMYFVINSGGASVNIIAQEYGGN